VNDTPDASAGAQGLAERATAALFARDRASQALGMRITGVRPGWARVVMPVRPDMVNGHGVCHGGLVFALGDSAFAFACNSYNDSTVAAAVTIDFLAAARAGDELTAEASELWRTRRNGLYEIVVTNQRGERIALFRGRSYRVDGQVVDPATSPPDRR
jgi:acyl-CoA thioesterase